MKINVADTFLMRDSVSLQGVNSLTDGWLREMELLPNSVSLPARKKERYYDLLLVQIRSLQTGQMLHYF